MKIAYFDILSGISGDMTLGACVSAGVSFDFLRDELRKLPLEGYAISQRSVTRNGIHAVKIDVLMDSGSHEHHHRGYPEIAELIGASTLPASVRERATAMFLILARAEAHVHDTTVEKVHFHEVGAIDSIIDIVGTAICIEALGIESVYTSPVRTGSGGTIRTQHGIMPVPAPATMEILKEYPVELTDIPHELTTPTGATIVATLSAGIMDRAVPLTISAIGYGAGSKEITGTPNLLRLLVGNLPVAGQDEQLLQLETNIDDMNPELYPSIFEHLFDAGACDVWLTPVLMKKGRPAHVLSVLAPETQREQMLGILYAESTTAGVRMRQVQRHALPREIRQVETRFGTVSVKVIGTGEQRRQVPEYEECRRIAQERKLPLIQTYQQILQDLAYR
ncbi:MAG: nickel pincer cofactor biosynthesis protein LarC [Bacteroidetes bacterium]|nr:nickel pincer cofactor biosynthesis protein LarC [Bacteroidota bacterium]